jgi:lysozyme
MMGLGPKGKALIESFESLRLASYQDQRGIWTLGWGHTGADVGPGQTCTPEQADIWFYGDTGWAARGVISTVDVAINQNQFDALVSFTFNVGVGSEAHSTLVRVLNAGNYMMAAEQFLVWNHVNGVVDAGLTRRRVAERALFLDTST